MPSSQTDERIVGQPQRGAQGISGAANAQRRKLCFQGALQKLTPLAVRLRHIGPHARRELTSSAHNWNCLLPSLILTSCEFAICENC